MRHHSAGLRRLTKDERLVKTIARDYRKAPLSTPDRSMLDYAVKLTKTPWSVRRTDVTKLRRTGFDDRTILDINLIVRYYAFVNRLADGLGVPLEDYRQGRIP